MSEEQTQTPPEVQVNPLLARARMPGETFTLPSQGVFYTNGELGPESKNGELYIYPMTTIDEIMFKTPDKLFSGEAIIDVFKHCVPGVKKPMELLAKDIDFILVCLRKLTYGDEMEISYTHDCDDAKSNNYKISMSPFITNSKRIDPTKVALNYSMTLDNDQVVKLIPPRFENVLEIYQSAANGDDEDISAISKNLFETIVSMIESVDGISDKKMIDEWVKKVSAGWVHQIGEVVETVSDWGPDFDTTVKCKDCGEDIVISTPINPLAFFI